MVYELKDTSKVQKIFANWKDTMIDSCMQQVMGKIYVTDTEKPASAFACSALILLCLEEGLYPSWDAQDMHSVRLAEKLGYEFDHAYMAYEVPAEARTHSHGGLRHPM